jgi:cytochrome c556
MIAGAIAIALSFASPVGPALSSGDVTVVKKRQEVMKEIVGHFKKIKTYAEGGDGSPADVAKRAARISELAKRIPSLFPEGSGRPTIDPRTTRASAKIWEDWAGFEAAAKRLEAEAGKLAQVAGKGDPFDIADQFVVTGKKGCGGCHKSFRGPKVE